MTHTSTDNDTDTVSNSVRIIKQNCKHKNCVEKTPTKNFEKINKKEERKQMPSIVPKSVHIPTLNEVESFFQQNNYSLAEAKKFFYYNQGKSWMLTDKAPITNWQAVAHKWMLNTTTHNKQQPKERNIETELQYLYEIFLQRSPITKFITTEHFDHLQLQLTEAIKNETIQYRVNQLEGTNQYSEIRLLQCYLGKEENTMLLA
ncbi:MAG: hypothetical protein J0I09_03690 [Sphingobacteriia bacterium]|nr:hypothetical protein [Sphingobacteriia bacterium]